MSLGRKQNSSHAEFVSALASITSVVSRPQIDALVASTAAEIRAVCRGKRAAFAWSGGKDSIALRVVCEAAGLTECVFVMTDLEYPAFLAWVTNNMPPALEVVNTGQNLGWLAAHQGMIFPATSDIAGKWFSAVQHKGQEDYVQRRSIEVLALGRRRSDGNNIPNANGQHVKNGVIRYAPLRDWSHESVLAVIAHYGLPMPPTYSWPRGFRVGTGPWPARQWTASRNQGWHEVFTIDPNVVINAASVIPEAAQWLAAGRPVI